MEKFPKNIFQVWFQGYSNIKDKSILENIDNWKMLNPDWKYHLYEDAQLQNACKMFSQECFDAYNSAKAMHTKIDMSRLVLVYLYGGIYTDVDIIPVKGLEKSDKIIEAISFYQNSTKKTSERHFLGLSEFNANPFEKVMNSIFFGKLFGTKGIMYNNDVVLSSPKNPYIKSIINDIIKRIEKENLNYSSETTNYDYVQNTSGPHYFNKSLAKSIENSNCEKKCNLENKCNINCRTFSKLLRKVRQKQDNVKIEDVKIITFPFYTFEPCIGEACYINKETIGIHLYEMSWFDDNYWKVFVKFYFNNKNFVYSLVLILLIIILYFVFAKNTKVNKSV